MILNCFKTPFLHFLLIPFTEISVSIVSLNVFVEQLNRKIYDLDSGYFIKYDISLSRFNIKRTNQRDINIQALRCV